MFKLNLKIAIRNLWKHKGYTLINIAGLSIGLASCILIFLFIKYEMSYDTSFAKKDRIYRVISSFNFQGRMDYSPGVPIPLAPAMRNDMQQIEKVAAIQKSGGIIKINDQTGNERIKQAEDVYYAEPQFFEIFDFKWLAGTPETALVEPNTVTLSETTAKKYFGDWQKAMGKSIRFQNKVDLRVTGVFKDAPQNCSFPLKIVLSYASYSKRTNTDWQSVRWTSHCYVLLKPGVSPANLDKPLQQFIAKYYAKGDNTGIPGHEFQPLSLLHHDERVDSFADKITPMKSIIGIGIIGVFLLLTACINFINLANAQAATRAREVGVRKVMGGRRSQLMAQFLSETTLITLFALLLASVLTELCLPAMANLLHSKMSFNLIGNPSIVIFMLALLALVSFLAGCYPAMILSGLSPVLAIKNKILGLKAGGTGLRKILVIVQFTITSVLIIVTVVVVKQMSFISKRSLGFDTQAIAMVDVPSDSLAKTRYQLLGERLAKLPGVKSLSFCYSAPSSENDYDTNFSFGGSKKADFNINVKAADENYFKTFGMQIIAGKALSKSDTIKEYVVNETLLKKLNITDPNAAIGKILEVSGNKAPIVGVVKDFNNHSLRESISPIAIFSRQQEYTGVAVKIDASTIMTTMKAIEKEWNSVLPEYVYGASFLDDSINSYYNEERTMGALFRIFAGVVIFISFIGLFGLISFVATQRTREVAIRKVLGASTTELMKMLNSSFVGMALIANVVAWPLAYIFVSKWLSGFVYRIELGIWPFALAMLASMLLTLVVVSLRSYRAAKSNPVDALKYE